MTYSRKRAAQAVFIEALHPGPTSAEERTPPDELAPQHSEKPVDFDGGVREPAPPPPQTHDEFIVELIQRLGPSGFGGDEEW